MSAIDVVDGARSQQRAALGSVSTESHQGAFDMRITTIGLDIAKNVFHVQGIDTTEKVVVRSCAAYLLRPQISLCQKLVQ
jgi:hypothetical protein